MTKNVLLFGSGYMAEEYLKVLKALSCRVAVIGRDEKKAKALAAKYRMQGFGDSLKALSKIDVMAMDLAIIASSVESLCEVALGCLSEGIKNILIEKPGALNVKELETIKKRSKGKNIRIAYNRRFYNSVRELQKRITADGGVLACFFDFTDREKDVLQSAKDRSVTHRWGLANSSHVIDTAFYLIGLPQVLHSIQDGRWNCHPTGNIFVGSGKTNKCPFSYFATWSGGGRWNVEVSTREGRYKLSPLEELQFCKKNQFVWEKIVLTDRDDQKFKPGLYKMVKSVLTRQGLKNLPDLDGQIKLCKAINKIFAYAS